MKFVFKDRKYIKLVFTLCFSRKNDFFENENL